MSETVGYVIQLHGEGAPRYYIGTRASAQGTGGVTGGLTQAVRFPNPTRAEAVAKSLGWLGWGQPAQCRVVEVTDVRTGGGAMSAPGRPDEAGWAERTDNGHLFTGSDIDIYRAIVIASALDLYARTKLRVNRAYTPSNMLRAAGTILGRTFKRGQYVEAATMLRSWAEAAKGAPRQETKETR